MAKKKFYAIRSIDGETINEIETDWSECEKRVKGHNCQYKSFTTEAEAKEYLGDYKEEEKEEDVVAKGEYIYYVDGSYMNDMIGWGVIATKNDKEITRIAGGIQPSEDIGSRNIEGELEASKMAVRHAVSNGIKKFYIGHDLQGISSYITGAWEADKQTTKDYTVWMKNKIKEHGLDINFIKIKGHTGHKWNDKADKLAKLGTEL